MFPHWFLICICIGVAYWATMFIYTWCHGKSHPLWGELPFWVKTDICSRAAWGVPLLNLTEFFKARKVKKAVTDMATVWKDAIKDEMHVDTLEGFRSLVASPSLLEGKALKLVGEFTVSHPIQVLTNLTVMNLEEAKFIYGGCPVFELRGTANAFIGATILGAPEISDEFPLSGDTDLCLIRTIEANGNLFMGLSVNPDPAPSEEI